MLQGLLTMSTHTPAGSFDLRIEHVDDYEFRVVFDKSTLPSLLTDEPPPLGEHRGPNPARLLAAAIGSCLSASLTFCLNRANLQLAGLTSEVHTELTRNERRRLRIGKVRVLLHPSLPDAGPKVTECLDNFEDFCVVTESVRQGIPVEVRVQPAPAVGGVSSGPGT